jgi:hypothetical protein
VGDHDDRLPAGVQLLQDRHDLVLAPRVEVAGGLVGEYDARVVYERAGDGDPLLLPARKLSRQVFHPVGQPDVREALPRGLVEFPLARVHQRELRVLKRGQAREQMELLEDETRHAVAKHGKAVVVEPADVVPVEKVGAAVRPVEKPQDVEQRRLPRARRPHDGDEFALVDAEAHVGQSGDTELSGFVQPGNVS